MVILHVRCLRSVTYMYVHHVDSSDNVLSVLIGSPICEALFSLLVREAL